MANLLANKTAGRLADGRVDNLAKAGALRALAGHNTHL
jgi:hypothetical protein